MTVFKVIVLLVIIVCKIENSFGKVVLQPAIINGFDVDITEAPYQLMLTYNEQFQCGAALISSKYVLTAAHCLYYHGFRSKQKLSIFAGVTKKSRRLEEGYKYGVKNYIVPAFFILTQYAPDIAVICPDRNIEVNGVTVRPIALANQYCRPGYEALATGWGLVNDQDKLPDNLQATYIRTTNCETIEDSICADGYFSGICKGDSGGPLVYKNKLIGLSRAKLTTNGGCEQQFEIYTSIYHYRDFIRKYTGM